MRVDEATTEDLKKLLIMTLFRGQSPGPDDKNYVALNIYDELLYSVPSVDEIEFLIKRDEARLTTTVYAIRRKQGSRRRWIPTTALEDKELL